MAAPVPRLSLPSSWFLDPFWASVRKLVRPSTSTTRRKELEINMRMPRETFEEIMAPVKEGEVVGLKRDPITNLLLPTKPTGVLNKFEYTIRRGGVYDRLFALDKLDPPAPAPAKAKPMAETTEIGETDIYEVEAIVDKRKRGTLTEYEVKWEGWDASTNTWERKSRIHPALVAAYEGKPLPTARGNSAPELPKRGAGCARAHLSAAEQRRGAVPESMSMVCGNATVTFTERRDEQAMPRLKLTMYVLTMDKHGHVTFPTSYDKEARAAMRMQARALLKKMIEDPLNPCDATMAPALTATGTSSVWKAAPKRKLVEADEE